MRKMCLDCVYELAKKDKRVVFIGSDIGAGTLDKFKKDMPDRFFMEGISEANIVGMAAGMAKEGFIIYINTIATFITRRSFEQDVLDLGLHNLPVRLLGSGGGLVYAPLGPTHLAIDDIAIMRTIPNMTVVAPADATEMERLMMQTVDYPGPIYVRIAKGGDPIVTPKSEKFTIGKAVPIRQGNDALIITTGITLKLALEAAEILNRKKIDAAILHLPTIKPLDKKTIIKWMEKVKTIITVEEHTIIGGLGSAICEIIATADFPKPKKFIPVALPDAFPQGYGNQAGMMERYGISTAEIVKKLRQAIRFT
jgi:transketolase